MNLPGYTAEKALRQTIEVYYGASSFGNWSCSGKALSMQGYFLSRPLGVFTHFRPRTSWFNFPVFVGDGAIDRMGFASPHRFTIGQVECRQRQVGLLIKQELSPCESPVTFTCNNGCRGGICCLSGPSTDYPSCSEVCIPGSPEC